MCANPGYDYEVQFLPGARGIRIVFPMTSVTGICTRSVARAREVVERRDSGKNDVLSLHVTSTLVSESERLESIHGLQKKKIIRGACAHAITTFSCKSFPHRVQTVSPSVPHKHCTGEHTHAVLNVHLRWNDDEEIVRGYCRKDDSPRLHFRTSRGPAVGWDIRTKNEIVLVLPEAICTHLEFGVRRGNVHFSYVPRVAMIPPVRASGRLAWRRSCRLRLPGLVFKQTFIIFSLANFDVSLSFNSR